MNRKVHANQNSHRQSNWLRSAAVYADRRVLAILFLGFSSGLPLALTFGTLSIWLVEEGVSKTAIGLFALVGAPYTFKFLWSPLVDRLTLPFFTRRFGQRRGWTILTQLALMAAIFGLGSVTPSHSPMMTAFLALLVVFCSASQDIVIDAYRVEILTERQYGAGAAMIVLGYRIGMLVSGAGALYLSSFFGWHVTYAVMAGLMIVGIGTILVNPEPERLASRESARLESRISEYLAARPHLRGITARIFAWVSTAVVAPFAEFMGRRGWLMVLLFILLYKFGDALAGVMSNPFYIELGFTKIEIANISKAFGLAATISGGVIGGMIVSRLGIIKSLFICGILQMISNLVFVLQAMAGHNLTMLVLTIGIENFSGGMGTAAFVAYLSSLCNMAYTATQYALLSSFMAFGRTMLSSSGGWLADNMNWVAFFIVTTIAALPGLVLLVWMVRHFKTPGDRNPEDIIPGRG
jgi:PAT family beta-lactamase induction signal transducer AmpG